MRRALTLPIGLDVGATRIRLAVARVRNGTARVEAIVGRDRRDDVSPAALVREAWAELDVPERRCVLALGAPEAELRPATLRPHRMVGSAQRAALEARLEALAATPLQALAVDHESLALQRALPGYRIVIDAGYERTSLHLFDESPPRTMSIPCGGREIALQIGRDLGIDARSAEYRKRTLGVNGAGEASYERLLAEIVAAMRSLHTGADRIALVGNNARLAGIAKDLASACACTVDLPESELLCGLDVAAAEWNLAAGLSIWMLGA